MSQTSQTNRQITEKVARRILGKAAEPYSADQLQDIVDRLYSMAEFSIRFDRGDFD